MKREQRLEGQANVRELQILLSWPGLTSWWITFMTEIIYDSIRQELEQNLLNNLLVNFKKF